MYFIKYFKMFTEVKFKNAQTKIQFTGLADSIIMMYIHILRAKDKGPV